MGDSIPHPDEPGSVGRRRSSPSDDVTRELAIGTLLSAVRMRDPGLADHGLRTGQVAAAISSELGASATEADRVYLGALLHDVGKLALAEALLWKPGALSAEEWDQVRTHPAKGHQLVAPLVDAEVASVVLHHHERFDGEGYPHRADLGALPMTVRIVQLADAYDAITSERPYARAQSPSAALDEIARCAGTQFDPEVAAALEGLLQAGAEVGTISLIG